MDADGMSMFAPAKAPVDRVNVLLVDDDESNLSALEALIGPDEFDLVRAQSGEEALRQILATDFAAIVMDVMMPGMDGIETARMLKRRQTSANIPVIFLTAADNGLQFEESSYHAGAVDYLVKPVSGFILRAKLRVFAELYRSAQALLSKTLEFERLRKTVGDDFSAWREREQREQQAIDELVAIESGTRVTAWLHGERSLRDSEPELFDEFARDYERYLLLVMDASVRETAVDVGQDIRSLATKLAFLSAGTQDVIAVHKTALAQACRDRSPAWVRAATDEARYLLVGLLGHLLSLYRGMYKRQMGAFRRATAVGSQN